MDPPRGDAPSGGNLPWEALTAPAAPVREIRRRRTAVTLAAWTVAAAVFLTIALVAWGKAQAAWNRPPTAAERAAAARTALGRRWRTWPMGRLFPASLPYNTDLLSGEKAARVGISPGERCAAAVTGAVAAAARRDGCRGAVRATYVGGLGGIVFTAGVLAFPSPGRAAAFAHAISHDHLPSGLRAFHLAGTASARFTNGARQVTVARRAGPYVTLVVAGYADGRPASASGQHRPAVFAPAGQLAREILTPLTRPAVVRCGQPEWAC